MTLHHVKGKPIVRPMTFLWHPAMKAFVNPFISDGVTDLSLNQEPRTDLLRVVETFL
ncbi:hypothetical protein SHDE107825_14570 [Shewanella denitrificans]